MYKVVTVCIQEMNLYFNFIAKYSFLEKIKNDNVEKNNCVVNQFFDQIQYSTINNDYKN